MTTSRNHEQIKNILRALLEVYMVEAGMDFGSYGHYTMELPEPLEKAVAIEADECYLLGLDQSQDRWPDLAIEVIWTSGGVDKLEAYRRLGVREVWFWIDGEIDVHLLVGGRYERRDHSELVPGIDLAQLASYVDEPVLSKAIRAYGDALRDARSR